MPSFNSTEWILTWNQLNGFWSQKVCRRKSGKIDLLHKALVPMKYDVGRGEGNKYMTILLIYMDDDDDDDDDDEIYYMKQNMLFYFSAAKDIIFRSL
jgi:hypothetical protein